MGYQLLFQESDLSNHFLIFGVNLVRNGGVLEMHLLIRQNGFVLGVGKKILLKRLKNKKRGCKNYFAAPKASSPPATSVYHPQCLDFSGP